MAMFDDLNDALMKQMKTVQDAKSGDKEERDFAIEQSKAVAALASNVIANANTAIRLVNMQSMEGVDRRVIEANTPRLLKGAHDGRQ